MMLTTYPGRCLRSWSKRSACNACWQACPTGAVRLGKGPPVVDESKCLACGACAGACPTGAFDAGVDGLVRAVRGGRILVSCRVKGEGVVAACIGALKLDHYFILASRSEELVVDARCEGCPARDPGAVERAVRAAELLPGVEVLRGGGPPSPLIKRRGLAVVAVKALALATDVRVSHVSIRGEGLEKAVKAAELRGEALKAADSLGSGYPRLLPHIDQERCEYCGICVALCPATAIEAPGDGSILIDLNSCVSCGLCAESCPASAITMEESNGRGRLTLYVEVRQCPVCGYLYPARLGSCPKCRELKRMVLEVHGAGGGGRLPLLP